MPCSRRLCCGDPGELACVPQRQTCPQSIVPCCAGQWASPPHAAFQVRFTTHYRTSCLRFVAARCGLGSDPPTPTLIHARTGLAHIAKRHRPGQLQCCLQDRPDQLAPLDGRPPPRACLVAVDQPTSLSADGYQPPRGSCCRGDRAFANPLLGACPSLGAPSPRGGCRHLPGHPGCERAQVCHWSAAPPDAAFIPIVRRAARLPMCYTQTFL